MDFLGPYHPLIVHTPVALLIFSFLFDLAGRAMDSTWMRKAGLMLLVIGVLGGVAAIYSGEAASEVAEEKQGVPEAQVERHEDIAKISVWLGLGSLAARGIAAAMPAGAVPVAIVAFLLHGASVVSVGIAGYRGGQLVFEHAAGVHMQGQLITHADSTHTGSREQHEHGEGEQESGKDHD